jgi:hypothetical protein
VKFAGCLVDLRGVPLRSEGFFLRINDLEGFDFNDCDFGPETKFDQALVVESLCALGEQLKDDFFMLLFEFEGVGMNAGGSRIKFQDQQVVKPHNQISFTVKDVQGHLLL